MARAAVVADTKAIDATADTAEETPGTRTDRSRSKKQLSRTARIALIVLAVIVALAIAVFAYAASTYHEVSQEMAPPKAERAAIVEELQEVPKGEPTYLLLLGNDRRPGSGWARSDTVILVRMEPDTKAVSMMSLARDTRVAVPGHGMTKLAHASAFGGPALTIKTVKQLTGLPVNHYVQVDFEGFAAIVDALGGVKMNVDKATTSPEGVFVPAGKRNLTGKQALAFVRNRKGYAAGDHQRMKNQQAFLFALAKKASKPDNFSQLPGIIRSVSSNLQTDMGITELMDLAGRYRGIDKKDLFAKSAPVKGAMIGGGSYQILKAEAFKKMLEDLEDGGFEPKVAEPSKQVVK